MTSLPTMTYGLTPVEETSEPDRFAPILNGLNHGDLRWLTEDQLRLELQDEGTRCEAAARFCRQHAKLASGDMVNWWSDRAYQLECFQDRARPAQWTELGLAREIENLYPY